MELTGEQKKILTLPRRGAILIRGGAGAGKTVVAVKRAIYLALIGEDLFRKNNKIIIFTFNKELVAYIWQMFPELSSHKNIDVTNIDKWVKQTFFPQARLIDAEICQYALEKARQEVFAGSDRAIAHKSPDFYEEEIKWLKGREISSLEQYCETPRTGRGIADRVTADDRKYLWNLSTKYNGLIHTQNVYDFDDRVEEALKAIQGNGFPDPYMHIVIDEAQDFTLAKIKLIKQLISPETNSITLVADSAQQIYRSGFSWADTGISVKGRSFELKHNYRNTQQIAAAAYSLMRHEKDNADFTEMFPAKTQGMKPVVVSGDEKMCMKDLRERLTRIPNSETAAVAFYRRRDANAHQKEFGESVQVKTFHALKGLQFDHVFLWGVSDRVFPPGDADEEKISESRKLLYVGMTRAVKTLTIYCVGKPSPFINEIDPDTITREGNGYR